MAHRCRRSKGSCEGERLKDLLALLLRVVELETGTPGGRTNLLSLILVFALIVAGYVASALDVLNNVILAWVKRPVAPLEHPPIWTFGILIVYGIGCTAFVNRSHKARSSKRN